MKSGVFLPCFLPAQLCWFRKEAVILQWSPCAYRWLCFLIGINSCAHALQSYQHFLLIIFSMNSDYSQFFTLEVHGGLFFVHPVEFTLTSKFDCACMAHVQKLWICTVTAQGYCWTQEIFRSHIVDCPANTGIIIFI